MTDAVVAAGLDDADLSAADRFHRPFPSGAQYTQVRDGSTVGQPTMHQSAEVQVTGEAEYADDIAKPVGMLHAALVLSTVPHGKILDIDPAAALATPGVHGFFSAKDVPNNVIGPAVLDEEVFASEYVTCVGHPVGIVVADTQDIALEASRLVRVKYEELPAILNIDEAIAADSYHTWPGFTDHGIEDGDVDAAMAECEAAGRVVEETRGAAARSTSTSSRWSASCGAGTTTTSSPSRPRRRRRSTRSSYRPR